MASDSVPLDGVEAKLNIASQAPMEQSKKAAKMRGLKNPDWELVFLRIGVVDLSRRQRDLPFRSSDQKVDAFERQKV